MRTLRTIAAISLLLLLPAAAASPPDAEACVWDGGVAVGPACRGTNGSGASSGPNVCLRNGQLVTGPACYA